MRLLLVTLDTESENQRSLGQLHAICSKYQLDIVAPGDLGGIMAENYDVWLLAGEIVPDAKQNAWYGSLVELIRGSGNAVVGVGLGFEIVCAAFNVVLADIAEIGTAATVMVPTEDGAKLFQGTDPIRIHEQNRWLVERESLPKVLQALALSEDVVEAFKHKNLPVYALQLYPEDFEYPSDGKLVFENLLAGLKKAAPRSAALLE